MAARSASELSSHIELAKQYGIVEARAAFGLVGSVICTRRMIRSLQDAFRESEEPRKRLKKPRRGVKARRRAPKRRPPKAD
jgi:hypothetical protein